MKILQFLRKQIESPNKVGFIVAFAIYASAITMIFGSFKNTELKQNGQSNLTMSLASVNTQAHQKTHSTSVPKPKPKPKPKKTKPIEKKQIEPQKETKEIQETKDEEKQETSNTTSEGSQAESLAYNEGVSDEFLAKIQMAISKKNKYPRIARIRGLEGEVMVEFVLNMDGTMQGLKILQSTAGDILNDSAIKAIKSASKDFPLPTQRVRIKIPIAYTLKS